MDWDDIYMQLEDELGREPTDDEITDYFSDLCNHTYDNYKELIMENYNEDN